MPLKACESDGKPGYKWGDSGSCYVYPKGDKAAQKAAKKKAIKQAIASGSGKVKNELADDESRELLRELEAELATENLLGVEIMATGGPIHGIGSPPEGDFWTPDDLRGMALADEELGDEILPPVKIGHPDEQTILANSVAEGELPAPRDGELPSAGWVENIRTNETGTRLLGDFMRVPKTIAKLIRGGAYRTRSVELSKVSSQTSEKSYEWVVTAVAFLGGKMPAVRTLGDVVKLYEGAEIVRLVNYASATDVVWNPDDGLEAIRSAVRDALNPSPPGVDMPGQIRFWVRDVSTSAALVTQGYDDDSEAWVVGFTRNADGSVTLDQSIDWQPAEQVWVAAAKSYELAESGFRERRDDSRSQMADLKLSEEQRRLFAEAAGVEDATALTDDELLERVKGETTPPPDPTPPPAPEPVPPTSAEGDRSLEQRVEASEERTRKLEEDLRLEKRKAFVEAAIRGRKVAPGQSATLETLYDRDPAAARQFVDELPEREDLEREFGSDEDGDLDPEQKRELEDERYLETASSRLGISKETLI